jgi:hypothetical protein
MFSVGDIIEIFAPQAGKDKYHLCICMNEGAAHQFVYLNSNPNFEGTISFDCERIPCLPKSKTGKTAFSFAYLPRYNDRQLKLYKAKKLGTLDPTVAKEVLGFVATVGTLTGADRKLVSAGFKAIIGEPPPAANNPSTGETPGE